MKTIAVYTYMQEDAPAPAQPHNAAVWKSRGFDFICFVRKKGDLPDFMGAWYVDELPISWEDERLNAAMPKLNPQSVLEEFYEFSVWVDPDTVISDDGFYERCKALQESGAVYADLRSTSFRSVYSYAYRIWKDGLEPSETVRKAVFFLLKNGIGPWAGFHDTAVLFRKHEDEAVLAFDRWWWECLVDRAGGHYDRLMHIFALKDTPSLTIEFFQ